jgi:hypothetical protein
MSAFIEKIKAPAIGRGFYFCHFASRKARPLDRNDHAQERQHAENNDDDATDLFGATIERQHVDEIEDKNNDKKRDQCADKHANTPKDAVARY